MEKDEDDEDGKVDVAKRKEWRQRQSKRKEGEMMREERQRNYEKAWNVDNNVEQCDQASYNACTHAWEPKEEQKEAKLMT